MITKDQLQQLANHHGEMSFSLLMPTHRSGMEVKEDKDKIVFKNQVKQLEKALDKEGYNEMQIKEELAPFHQLEREVDFWSKLDYGLAIYKHQDHFEVFKVPESLPTLTTIQDTFYLTPLFPIYQHNKPFYLLELNLSEVILYKADRYSIQKMEVPTITPQRLEEVVGYDYRDKSLQLHAHGSRAGEVLYHGHGEGRDDEKIELEKFFEAIDNGLMAKLEGENLPLMLACVDYFHPIFRRISKYKNIQEQFVKGSQKRIAPQKLHEQAVTLMEDFFATPTQERLEKFNELAGTGKTAQSVENILTEAENGRVAHLFLQYPETKFGRLDEVNRTIIPGKNEDAESKELLNEIARLVFNNGGTIDLLPDEEFPVEDAYAVAVFRY